MLCNKLMLMFPMSSFMSLKEIKSWQERSIAYHKDVCFYPRELLNSNREILKLIFSMILQKQ